MADLAADLLAARGHSEIRITDGPGDGGRDIHSIDRRGDRHLTQSKYHRKASRSTSSKEIGELPLSMVKLGYKRGLFITNSRISPQSKREFLDNYRELSLDFLDGLELTREVLNNILLRAVWFDGQAIERVSYAISFDVLIRDLVRDKPISTKNVVSQGRLVRKRVETNRQEDVTFRLQVARTSVSDFAPYRPPNRKTMAEGWWPVIETGEFVLTGVPRVGEIIRLRSLLAHRVVSVLARRKQWTHFAVRIGRPFLTALHGDKTGARLEVPAPAFTLVSHDGTVSSEARWLLPSSDSKWYRPRRLSAVIADWVRWYNPTNDVCLDINVITPPSEYGRGTLAEQLAFDRRQWSNSVFALFSAGKFRDIEATGVTSPSKHFQWCADKVFGCWFFDTGPFRQMEVEAEDDREEHASLFGPDPAALNSAREQLTAQLVSAGAEIVDPIRARHMYALVSDDPFKYADEVMFRSIDLMHEAHDLPSPVDPMSRRFRFATCWELDATIEAHWSEAIHRRLETMCSAMGQYDGKIVHDRDNGKRAYLVLYLDRVAPTGQLSSEREADAALTEIVPFLEKFESELQRLGRFRRATRRFWEQEIGVVFSAPSASFASIREAAPAAPVALRPRA